jgi:hypothetical protein
MVDVLQEYRANVTSYKGSCKYAQGEYERGMYERLCTSLNDPEGVLGLMQVGFALCFSWLGLGGCLGWVGRRVIRRVAVGKGAGLPPSAPL